MLKSLAHRLVAIPWVYDAVQVAAGIRYLDPFLQRQIDRVAPGATVVDIGGGTGRMRKLWHSAGSYTNAEPDPQKLAGFKADARALGVLADGRRLPMDDQSVDVVMLVSVAHHLTDEQFRDVLAEARRVLRPDGRFMLFDPVWEPGRALFPLTRLLWHFDRGSYSRREGEFDTVLREQFEPVHVERIALYHAYVLWVGRPK